MHESIQKAAHLAFLAEENEKLHPDARLQKMGETKDQEVDGDELFD